MYPDIFSLGGGGGGGGSDCFYREMFTSSRQTYDVPVSVILSYAPC